MMLGQAGAQGGIMAVTLLVNNRAFETALDVARRLGTAEVLQPRVLDAPLKQRVDTVWETIEAALRAAHERGKAAQPLIDTAEQALDDLLTEARGRAADIKLCIAEKLRRFEETVVEESLAQVKPEIRVGGVDLKLAAVRLAEKLKLGGDLHGMIETLCAASATGELAVEVNYTR
jgi:hypothetical protein